MTPYIYAGLSPRNKLRYKLTTIRRKEVTHSEKTLSEVSYYANHIFKRSANHFQVTEVELKGRSRLREIAEVRQIAMYAIKSQCQGATLKSIGKMFNRDHTTVLHSITVVTNLFQTNKNYKSKVTEFLNSL